MPWRKLLDTAQRASSCARDSFLAVEDDQLTLTLDELHNSASSVARGLAGLVCCRTTDTCALFVDKDATCVVAALGALMAGVRFVEPGHGAPPEQALRLWDQCGCAWRGLTEARMYTVGHA